MTVDLYCERSTNYTHVASFNAGGTATFGSWDGLYEAAVENGAKCKVRFDMISDTSGRIHPIPHLEWGADWMNLDFLGLHGRYDNWDGYAYINIIEGSRAGIGASYRRGRVGSSYVEAADRSQHVEAEWHAMGVDVYCADIYDEVYEINLWGGMDTGEWDDLFRVVTDEVRDCRIAYNNRVSDPEHIQYSAGYIAFDFMNLHGYYDSYDAFALVDINEDRGAGLRSCMRRGNVSTIWNRTSSQYALSTRNSMDVRVLCESEPSWHRTLVVDRNGETLRGDRRAFYNGMQDEETAYECRIRFSFRISNPVLLDYSWGPLNFDYLGLTAYHNGWDAYASTVIDRDGRPGIGASMRRGIADQVWQTDRVQYSLSALNYYDFDFYCR
jgi:hypothetical protein